jgi:phospholipase D1/2
VNKLGSILKEGRNCWRIRNAGRMAFLVDGASYYEAFASAVEQAQKSIYIAGWDIDSRISLFRRDTHRHDSIKLKEIVAKKVKGTPGLHVHVLCWDFSMIYAFEREWLPIFKLGWNTSSRIHFLMDDEHPTGASQHQKIVVIDDRVAFSGGMDLTGHRWDTSEHRKDDPRRTTPMGLTYKPYHDVQMVVDGDAASTLGDLFRDRWQRITGKQLPAKEGEGTIPWPSGVNLDATDVRVAVARTFPAYKGRPEVREVEALYKDAIHASQNYIYIENQYLTSAVVAKALVGSLEQQNGPEIVLVLPKESSGWLEKSSMDAIRAKVLKHLFEGDQYGRLRVLYPLIEDGDAPLFVHSKVMISDDRFVRVGSANLSNRSMGLDSECDLAIESGDSVHPEVAATVLRNRLLAEHLGSTSKKVEAAMNQHSSLIRAIESLSGKGRTLKPLDLDQQVPFDGTALVPNISYIDPEKPIQMDQMIDQFVHDEKPKSRKRYLLKSGVAFLVLLGMAAAWRWTPLSEWIDVERMASWARSIEGSAFIGAGIVGAYIVGTLVMVPVTLLVGATAMVFTPLKSTLYALAGCLSSAVVTYAIGARLGKRPIRKIAGQKINRLSKILAEQGLLTIVIVRNLPVAPFTIVNLVAGASHIRFRDYLLGTALGMAPGILAISVFADRLILTVKDPGWWNISLTIGLAIVLGIGIWWAKKRISREK